jgi:hypothetical protein
LEGWAFHGTDAGCAADIRNEGVTTSFAIAKVPAEVAATDDPEWYETAATHWATPKVAAFYAEDRIEKFEDPDLDLAIVAIRMEDLEEEGWLAVDGQTLDCPIASRLGRTEEELDRLWMASAQGWRDCWELYGTVLLLNPVSPENLRIIREMDDLQALIGELNAEIPGLDSNRR